METWTFIISTAALGVSLYTYFAHDRKLKQQERLINSYQLKQLEEKEQANKKADIVGEISLGAGGDYGVLRVTNKGLASAKDIHIEGFDYENYTIHNIDILPYDCLNAGEYFSLNIFRMRRSLPTMTITFVWDDEWKLNRKKRQTIQLR